MATTKRIKVWLNWVRSAPGVLKVRGDAVYVGMNENPAFSEPPFPLSELKAESDGLLDAIAATEDGGRLARTELKRRRALVVNMLRELAHYVELNCDGDAVILRSSGFEPAPTTRVPDAPAIEMDPQPSPRSEQRRRDCQAARRS